jgi:malate synthase
VTKAFFEKCLKEEMKRVKSEVGNEALVKGRFREAVTLFKKMSTSRSFETFLTLPAYRRIV